MESKHLSFFFRSNIVFRFYICLCFIVISFFSYSQQINKTAEIDLLQKRKQNVLKTDVFCPLWGAIPFTSEYRLVYETPTSLHSSVQFGISYLGKNFWLWPLLMDTLRQSNPQASQITIKGFRFQLAFKFYVFKDQMAPDGLYFAPLLSYSSAKFGTTYSNMYDTYIKAVYMNANLITGYQFFFMNEMAVDFYFGLGVKQNSWLEYQSGRLTKRHDPADFELIHLPFRIVLGMNVGIGK
jgi:hypothetical protein